MAEPVRYLLDADTFIRSKRQHYAYDFCPAYWEALIREHDQGLLSSIMPVREELLRGKNWLADWVRDIAPADFFEPVDDEAVQRAYASVMAYVNGDARYKTQAKARFARGADPWLIAFAIARNRVLVTYEARDRESTTRIKLPDVADHFELESMAPYVMLRQLNVQFHLADVVM